MESKAFSDVSIQPRSMCFGKCVRIQETALQLEIAHYYQDPADQRGVAYASDLHKSPHLCVQAFSLGTLTRRHPGTGALIVGNSSGGLRVFRNISPSTERLSLVITLVCDI
jgi:hypothetical protein